MTSQELLVDLKALDERFSVVENPNRAGLSNIFFTGLNYDLPAISTENIPLEVDQAYRYQFPNGMSSRLWCKQEILDRCASFLKEFNEGKFKGMYE